MAARYVIFMAGGKGERFWPLSRPHAPKHLLKLFEGKSLMELSVERVAGLVPAENVRVITSQIQVQALQEALPQLSPNQILVEPVGRDTAAAVALATRWIQARDPHATIAMLPADHFVKNAEGFRATLQEAFSLAENSGHLVTVGIPPTRPATGYGYLQRGSKIREGAFRVRQFREKPQLATAQEYLESGEYFWNAGIFVWTVEAIVAELKRTAGDIWGALEAVDPTNAAAVASVYPTLRKISIDYAVMERAEKVAVVPAGFDWDDVGEWTALPRLSAQDSTNNVVVGEGVASNSNNCLLVNTQPEHLVVTFGVQDQVVVHTPQVTLIMPPAKAQELKNLIKELGVSEALKKYIQ